jgi:hypothetical protein
MTSPDGGHPSISTVLFEALRNERRLDIEYRRRSGSSDEFRRIPNYKIMKQAGLIRRLGILYQPFLYTSCAVIPVLTVGQFAYALLVAALSKWPPPVGDVHIIATAANNVPMIQSAIAAINGHTTATNVPNVLRIHALAVRCGMRGVIEAFVSWTRLLGMIHRSDRHSRMDLLLHSRDACALALLAHFAAGAPNDRVFTDAHYERQSFVLSHLTRRLAIVQHGYIDGEIPFDHAFGRLERLFVCDASFVEAFERYYAVAKWNILAYRRTLTTTSIGDQAVFLASSFPSIDMEIELVTKLAAHGLPIIVKLHPNHTYDARRERLLEFASHVCRPDEFPICGSFVSYASFLEYQYRLAGIATYSIARSGVDVVVDAIGASASLL